MVWVVSPDNAADLAKLREKLGLGFPTLSDADLATIRGYGILNPKSGKLPHPTALVIDREGVVRYVRVDEDYKQRPPSAVLLAVLEGLGKRSRKSETSGAAGK